MKRVVFDMETDNLIENVTKIHCFCYYDIDTKESNSIASYEDIIELLSSDILLIGHNCIRYDIPILEKLLKINLNSIKRIDTLGLSWYLYPTRLVHGLNAWGKDFSIEKPKITDWKEGSLGSYIYRCTEDVRINTKLWEYEIEYLNRIYNKDQASIDNIIGYLGYKLECAREQEEVKIRIDIEKCNKNLEILKNKSITKHVILSEIMPPYITYKIKARPKIMSKKDGTISKLAEEWYRLLKEQGLPDYHNGALKLVDKVLKGNPTSHAQLKDWLLGIGWKPITFKFVRETIGGITDYSRPAKKIAQLASDDNTGLCQSVKELFEKEPRLVELEELFIINHRINILKGFLESINTKGFLKAEIAGFTNTLRFQHRKPIANLPTIPKPYWEMVRECLIAPDNNHVLCGSDMSGLEDSTKRHYMYYYDPEYVREMMIDGFDPHLDVAVLSGLLTQEELEEHKLYDISRGREGKSHKAVRLKAKKTNFAAIYGAKPAKIAVTANISLKEATTLYNIYWKRNWSVKKVADNTIWKKVDGQMWLFNPISKFWYSLRADKDKFSTLNQSSGVYAFDTWIRECRNRGIKICMQYHDELISPIFKSSEGETKKILLEAIDEVNNKLKLNIKLGISIDVGHSYAAIH